MTALPTAWEARAAQDEIYERLTTMVETGSLEAATALFSQIPVPSIFADVSSYSPIPDVRPAVLPTILRGAGSSNLPSREQLARITQPTLILSWATDPTPCFCRRRGRPDYPQVAANRHRVLHSGEKCERFQAFLGAFSRYPGEQAVGFDEKEKGDPEKDGN